MEEKQTITLREIWQMKSARSAIISIGVLLVECVVAEWFPALWYVFVTFAICAGIAFIVSLAKIAKHTMKG